MINYFRTACVKNDLKKPIIVKFLDFLANNKDQLCLNSKKSNTDPLIDSLEQQKKFEMFIERFFKSLQHNSILQRNQEFETQEIR